MRFIHPVECITQSGGFGVSDAEYERSVKSDQDPSEILRFSEMKFPVENDR